MHSFTFRLKKQAGLCPEVEKLHHIAMPLIFFRNRGYYEVQLPSGIVGIMRHNFLWYLQRFTLLSNVKKTKNVNVYNIFIYELNKRIDEIKNHSMNNSFLYAMKKKINSS